VDLMNTVDESALAALPLFPLPDVVLFPGALLPLHVFEPRYRALAADVLAGPRLIAMPRLQAAPGTDPARPAIYPVCGLGYVVASQTLDDGRYHILVRGVARVEIDDELPLERAYRQSRAHVLVDSRSRRPDSLDALVRDVLLLVDRLALVLPEGGSDLRTLAHSLTSPAALADVLAATLVHEPDARQRLLESLDPADRLETTLAHVAGIVARLGGSSGMRN
jgi:hypothetical protein